MAWIRFFEDADHAIGPIGRKLSGFFESIPLQRPSEPQSLYFVLVSGGLRERTETLGREAL